MVGSLSGSSSGESAATQSTFERQEEPTTPAGIFEIKYEPSVGSDVLSRNGVEQHIDTLFHCITAMEFYESKCLDELRFEYYERKKNSQAGAKGFQQNKQQQGSNYCFQNLKLKMSTISSGDALSGFNFEVTAAPVLDPKSHSTSSNPIFQFECSNMQQSSNLFGKGQACATNAIKPKPIISSLAKGYGSTKKKISKSHRKKTHREQTKDETRIDSSSSPKTRASQIFRCLYLFVVVFLVIVKMVVWYCAQTKSGCAYIKSCCAYMKSRNQLVWEN